jgi:protein DGCR14
MSAIEATPRTRAALTKQQQQLQKYNASTAGGTSINRQTILSEDDYLEGLERIIARDFFPALSAFKYSDEAWSPTAADEVMRGLSSRDPDVIEASVRRVEDWMDTDPRWSTRYNRRSVHDTPRVAGNRAGETPRTARGAWDETPHIDDRASKRQRTAKYDTSLSLDDFQAKYTSEDNASFAEIVEHENLARRSKYAWAFNAEEKANDKARRAIEAREKLVNLARRIAEGDGEVRMIEGGGAGRPGERMLIEGRSSLPGDKASLEFAKQRLIAAPKKELLLIEGSKDSATQGQEITAEEREKQLQLALQNGKAEAEATRAEAPDVGNVQGWPSTARNSFYFAPDANIPIHKMATHPLNKDKSGILSADDLGVMEPKSIRYNNTRLFSTEELAEAARKAGVPSSPSHSNIAAAISGTPCKPPFLAVVWLKC